jgi:hypothetical protein
MHKIPKITEAISGYSLYLPVSKAATGRLPLQSGCENVLLNIIMHA